MSKRPSRSIAFVRQVSPAASRESDDIVTVQRPRAFVSFQYSHTEVSSRDGRTHVQSNTTRFADGTLTREAFEGELEGDAHRQIVEETQRQLMRSLSWFLPWVPRLRSDRE